MIRQVAAWAVSAVLIVSCDATHAFARDDALPWTPSPWFDETSFTTTIEPNVRIHVNAPRTRAGRPARATRLIVFALPNGNTLEQTLGCRMKEGLDWHYDIQHIAAQTRLLRTLEPREQIVLICAEAPGLSWPTFRRTVSDANAKILHMVEQWREQFGADDAKVTLTGHSGGGSFIFGAIEAGDEIPAYVDRIAPLDANYSFDAALHAAKLQHWLKGNDQRRLIVLAYDDREITLNGKKVVGPDGGTFRATGRMRDALRPNFELVESTNPPFRETVGLDGQIHFYVHPNPENKILHTALVGEMNGLVHIQTLGTPQEEKWGQFGGPRAYTKWIQPEPTPNPGQPAPANHSSKKQTAAPQSQLPPRPANAVSGSEFTKQVDGMNLEAREAAILREIAGGNFPEFLRTFKTVEIRGKINEGGKEKEVVASLSVMPDYLAVGSDNDFVRMPMTPQTAQQIAVHFGCVLPTRKMVDAIDSQAEVHVAPRPMTESREAVETFVEHHQIIERQRSGKPLGLLITGIKKDIVLSPRIFERPQRLAIYGWRQLNGQPIQPLTIVHWNRYVDYSHGARLVGGTIELDGKDVKIAELLADPNRCDLVSDEGPIQPPRYPLAAAPSTVTDVIVYITDTGSKYHREGCRFVNKSKTAITLDQASAQYEPCKVCRPPLP